MTINFTKILLLAFIITSIFITSCDRNANETNKDTEQVDLSIIEKEINMRLREFERHLENGDSIALGNMYMDDAKIMPSVVGRDNIIKNFGGMIRYGITGSSFNTIGLWGNDQLLVEEGTGIWSFKNGQVAERGTYLVVWKKENGNWKIFRDIWFPEKKE